MVSVTTTPQVRTVLNRLVVESGINKRKIVNMGILALEKMSPAQRAALHKQLEGGAQ